jgi:hypothetical protein
MPMGEHHPGDIKKPIQPIAADKLDLVLGAGSTIPRPSKRVLKNVTLQTAFSPRSRCD